MTWKLVPLYYCPGKERVACIVFVCSQLAVLMFSSSSTSFQIGLFINGNKVMSYLKENGESGIHSSLFKGSGITTYRNGPKRTGTDRNGPERTSNIPKRTS